MAKSRNIGGILSFVSIRKAPAQNVLSDTNEYEKADSPVIAIEALRTINRIVRAIKVRIEQESLPDK